MRRAVPFLVPGILGVGLGVFLAFQPARLRPDVIPVTPPRPPRDFSGTVRVEGTAAAGARVLLLEVIEEDFTPGPVATADAEGAFRLEWKPASTDDPDRLFFAIEREDRPRLVVPRAALAEPIDMPSAVEVRGRVLDHEGRGIGGVRVSVAAEADPAAGSTAVSDEQGRFAIPGFPRGVPLVVLARRPGCCAEVVRGFLAGDQLTLRPRPGAVLRLRLLDPQGRPVAGARAFLPGPVSLLAEMPAAESDQDGRLLLEDASDGRLALVRIAASGFVPADFGVTTLGEQQITLWPARDVSIVAWDVDRRRGVRLPGLHRHSVELAGAGLRWPGASAVFCLPRYPLDPEGEDGSYRVFLPDCPVQILAEAEGYYENTIMIPGGARRAGLPLAPLPRAQGAYLEIHPVAPEGQPPRSIAVLVADASSEWYSVADVPPEGAQVAVPPNTRIQVASAGAAEGWWAPKCETDSPEAGMKVPLALALRPAVKVAFHVRLFEGMPAPEGVVSLIDLAQEGAEKVQRTRLSQGEATLWARPLRRVRLEVDCPGNYFLWAGERSIERDDIEIITDLRPAAAVRFRVEDLAGSPIAFARARLWGPSPRGANVLQMRPAEATADADGRVFFGRLSEGDAALEVSSPGFRTRRFSRIRAAAGPEGVSESVALEAAPRLRARVVDAGGQPVAGAWIRAMGAQALRIPAPGGGELAVYDILGFTDGDAVTDEQGRFEVLDETAGDALVAIHATLPEGSVTTAALPPADGEEIEIGPGSLILLEDLPGRVEGIYSLLPGGKAILLQIDPPVAMRPIPVPVRAGPLRLLCVLRDQRWAAVDLDLADGETRSITLAFRK